MEVNGKLLKEMGYTPGRWFKEAIEHANANSLQGDALKTYLDSVAPELIPIRDVPLDYQKNIRAESPDEESNVERVFELMDELMKTPTVNKGAVMPDACPTGQGQIPVGGVVSTHKAIHPTMHSADICCSVMMTSFGHVDPKLVMDAAHGITHFGGGGREDNFPLPAEIEERIKSNYFLNSEKSLNLAKWHLGTQGDGNHFLFIGQSEASGETIMVTHHGSRGFGANLYRKGMKAAEVWRREISPETAQGNGWIPYDDSMGKDYWEALQVVRDWTKLNHQVLHEATSRALGKDAVLNFWNEHNFVFKDGSDNFYHAKGATPLSDGFVPDSYNGLRLIPLNMSQPVLIVKGESTEQNMGFAPHGAGRNVSRTTHIRRSEGRSVEEIFNEETKGLDVRFYSGHIDISELPSAYKDADVVVQQMKEFGLGEVQDRILPYGSIMAGDWQKDAPWMQRRRRRKRRKGNRD